MSAMQPPRTRYKYVLMSNTTNNQLDFLRSKYKKLQDFIAQTGDQYSIATVKEAETEAQKGDWHAIKITPENINLKTQFLSARERKDPLLKIQNQLKGQEKMTNKTCGECNFHGVDCTIVPTAKACELFEPKHITNGDKIIAYGNRGIAAFVCGVLNDRSENIFQKLLDFLNAPAESEEER